MIRLEYKTELRYPWDIERMRNVLNAAGYEASENDIERVWIEYSDSFAAVWMRLPEDDKELLDTLLYYFNDVS